MNRQAHAQVIPSGLTANESFIRDLRRFLQLPTSTLAEIVEALDPTRFTLVKGDQLEDLATRFDTDVGDIRSAVLVVGYLRSRAQETGASGEEVVQEIRKVLSTQEDVPEIPDSLSTIFAYTQEDRREALARQAFSGPPTFLGSDFRAVFASSDSATGELAGGFLWTIHYLDSEGSSQSFTFAITPGELKGIQEQAQGALSNLRRSASQYGLEVSDE